jgi:predicted TIM-barrel fold metal-dependent hydrolase
MGSEKVAHRAVDAHAFVFSAAAPAVAGARYRPRYGADASAWKGLWRDSGVTHGVLVQPSFFGGDNREMLDTLAGDPGHLRGVVVLHHTVDSATLDRFDALGVRAMRLNLRGARDLEEYGNAAWHALFARVEDRGWHVEIFIDRARLPTIARALETSRVALVFEHFGVPGLHPLELDATFAAVERLAAAREVWCKFSAPYRLEGADAVALAKRWIEAVGRERIVWGSDWPWTGFEEQGDYARARSELDRWVDAPLRKAILWDNPARLYRFS